MTIIKSVRQILKEARQLIEGGWTQDEWARSSDGRAAYSPESNAPTCFCPWGAIQYASGLFRSETEPLSEAERKLILYRSDDAVTAIERALDVPSLITWNDDPERTKEEVLAAFDRAIETLREEDAKKRVGTSHSAKDAPEAS